MTEFAEVLRAMRNGASNEELSEQLQALVAKTQATGKESTLTYTIKIQPAGEGKVLLRDAITTKAAEANRESTIFFHNGQWELSRKSPNQYSLDDLLGSERKSE